MNRFPFKSLLLATALAFVGTVSAAPVSYTLDPNHTMVLASWSHFGYSHPVANFGQVDGSLVYDADDIAASSVKVSLPLAGLNSFSDDFDTHLRSADFFDAAKYPAITFSSTAVEAAGEGKLKITGDLTIKDITRSVVLDATLNKAGEANGRPAIGFDASTTILRSDFGLGMYVPKVSDEVTLRITTEAHVPKPDVAE